MKTKISVIINGFTQMECSVAKSFPYFEYTKPMNGCIESIEAQTYNNKEIIIADKMDMRGAGFIRNHAIKKATGDILLFMDADVILHDDKTFEKILNEFKRTGADVLIGTPDILDDGKLFIRLLSYEYKERIDDMLDGPVDAGATTFMALKRDVVENVPIPTESPIVKTKNKLFNSAFTDWDYCGLIKEAGYEIWHTGELRFLHYYQTDFVSYFKKQFWQGWYRFGFIKRFKIVKESYVSNKIMYQPIFFALLPFSLIFLGISAFILNFLVVFFWFTPSVIKFYKVKKDIFVVLLLPISFLRNISWLLGGMKGVYDYYVKTFINNKQ